MRQLGICTIVGEVNLNVAERSMAEKGGQYRQQQGLRERKKKDSDQEPSERLLLDPRRKRQTDVKILN